MKLDHWRTLLDHSGPFASVCLDSTRSDEAGAGEVRLRWEAARRALAGQGAPPPVLDALAPLAGEPTGRPGSAGRLVIAGLGASDDVKILLDAGLPEAPPVSGASWARVPQLMPAVRGYADATSYLLVAIDRAGADVEFHGVHAEGVETEQIDGDHDVLHKVAGGGWSQLRYQHRAEDSWERNATAVAEQVAKLLRRHRPQRVLLAGDERAATAFLAHAPANLAEATVRISSGGRAEGISEGARRAAVEEALAAYLAAQKQALVERFQQAEGRQDVTVQGFGDVVDALRRGQVEGLLLHDDPSSTLHLWIGDHPLQLGLTADEVWSMGARRPERIRADAGIAWACLATGAGITLLDEGHPRLNDGIGAVLRWSDRSTPREAVPSMPGHGESRGGEPVV